MTPKALETQPKLIRRWEVVKEMFNELTGSRRYTSNGPANIPVSEFKAFAAIYEFSPKECVDYWEDLQVVDSVWISEVGKKREAAEKQAKKGK